MEALGLETKVLPWTKLYNEKIFDLKFTVTSFLQYIYIYDTLPGII